MNIEPLVSIIMPTYNSASTISEAINSVILQRYTNWELIVTDDCSTDDTKDILINYVKNDSRIKFLCNQVNSGAGFSRNRSIDAAKGKYIAFLDADDLWLENKLSNQISFMEKNGYLFSFSSYQKFSKDGDGGVVVAPSSVTYQQLLYGNVIGCLTAVYNAEVLGKKKMPLIRKRQDMGLWLTLLKECDAAYSLPDVLAKYRTDTGMTQNKINTAKYQWEFYRTVVQLNLFKSSWYFCWYALNGLLKHRV
ncbi:glycosyltransferase family 2 protein [Aeromonas caviae]|uniref:glycosyltransferase family 2 protein n=1 Tax=Aeromonas TaxID=642 RepID=UPI0029DAF930|nr:glycosyltransferase family 2 protein [Aeromonas caviae]MDX7704046.1 glycosyltransferase family 2 protein [Aeromonas caviae]MDX7794199.1 glycosyltransferase family 2 protein [Aeromonas caviae]